MLLFMEYTLNCGKISSLIKHSLCHSPLTICPRAVVEVSSLSTDDVQTPTWRQVLELIALTARLCLLPALLLHRHQTYTHTQKHAQTHFKPETTLTTNTEQKDITVRKALKPLEICWFNIFRFCVCVCACIPGSSW